MKGPRIPVLLTCLLATAAPAVAESGPPPPIELEAPRVALRPLPLRVGLRLEEPPGESLTAEVCWTPRRGDGSCAVATLGPETAATEVVLDLPRSGRGELVLSVAGWETSQPLRSLPGWFSVLPALLAIALALATRTVIPALFTGVWLGAALLQGIRPWGGFLRSLDTYVLGALADPDHAAIILFTLLLGGMVGVMTRSGGTRGIVHTLAPLARTRRSAQVATWVMGLVIFFDDYANSLLVGNTMRPVTDRLRISREKLAYIVDCTAAPVASLAAISTWVGFEVSLIADAFEAGGYDANPFNAFLASIPYRFYPLLSLWLVLLVAWTGRDIGPMARAERRASGTGQLVRDGAAPLMDADALGMDADSLGAGESRTVRPRWWNAVTPVVTVIVAAVVSLWVTGRAAVGEAAGAVTLWERFREAFGEADPFRSLMWASMLGCIVALALPLFQRNLSIAEAFDSWLSGVKAMTLAVVVLLLAWSLGAVMEDLQAAPFLAGALSGALDPRLLPALVFLLAAGISFATGTSWGTMAILMPLVIPLGLEATLGWEAALRSQLLLGTISSVLAGAVFGDHCSPISDTTVLSSTASACDHVDHVRTQLPYALLAAGIGVLVGDLATAYLPWSWAPWAALGVGGALIAVILGLIGRRGEAHAAPDEGEGASGGSG